MAKTRVTEREAQRVLDLLRKTFKAYDASDAFLKPGPEEGLSKGSWALCWEGGLYDWPQLFPRGGRDEEFGFNWPDVSDQIPGGLFLEPLSSWGLGVYVE